MKIFEKTKGQKVYAFLYAFLFLLVACQNALNAPISEDKLVDVLLDIHTAEAMLEAETPEARDSLTKIYYPQICQRHNTTQIDFDSTMAIYSRYPTQLDSLYNRVLRIINAKKDTLHKPSSR